MVTPQTSVHRSKPSASSTYPAYSAAGFKEMYLKGKTTPYANPSEKFITTPFTSNKSTEAFDEQGKPVAYEFFPPSGKTILQAQTGSISGTHTHGIVLSDTSYRHRDWLSQNGAVWDSQQKKWIAPIGMDLTLFVKSGHLPYIDISLQEKKDRDTENNVREWQKNIYANYGRHTFTLTPRPTLSHGSAASSSQRNLSMGTHGFNGAESPDQQDFVPDVVTSSSFAMAKKSDSLNDDVHTEFSTESNDELFRTAIKIDGKKKPTEQITVPSKQSKASSSSSKKKTNNRRNGGNPSTEATDKHSTKTSSRGSAKQAAMTSKNASRHRAKKHQSQKSQSCDDESYDSSFVEKDKLPDQDDEYELSSANSSEKDSSIEDIDIESEEQFKDDYGSEGLEDDTFDSDSDDDKSDSTVEVIPQPKKRKFKSTKKQSSSKRATTSNRKSDKRQVTINETKPYAFAPRRAPAPSLKSAKGTESNKYKDNDGSDDDNSIIEILSADTPIDAICSDAQSKKIKMERARKEDWNVDSLSSEHEGAYYDINDLD